MTQRESVPIRPAATVLLLRDGAAGLEVFMVQRHHRIDFASSALVFPGGRVEDQDGSEETRAFCDGSSDEGDAKGVRVTALREAFEESGILLAQKNGSPLSGDEAAALGKDREDIEKGALSLASWLRREGLRLQCGALRIYARWITPAGMPKRFDTWFFAAAAPEGQVGLHDGRESVDSLWIRPQDALRDGAAGKRQIIFPTKMNLALIAPCASLKEAMAMIGRRQIVAVEPIIERRGEKSVLRIPKEAGYPVHEEIFDPAAEGIVRGGIARR